jgi:hypothetical protein
VSNPVGEHDLRDEVARLRAATTRLRQVVEAKDVEIRCVEGRVGQEVAGLVEAHAERLAVSGPELAKLSVGAG